MKRSILTLLVACIGFAAQSHNVVENGDFSQGMTKWTPGDSTSTQIIDGFCYISGDPFTLMQGLAQVGVMGVEYRMQFDYLSFVPFSVKLTRPGGVMTLVTLPATMEWQHFDTVFMYQYSQIRLLQFTGQLGNINLDNIVLDRMPIGSPILFGKQEVNYITNGTMEDEDSDNIADNWYMDNYTDGFIEGGWQYCSSPYACEFWQEIDIPNPNGRTFRLQFDIESNDYTQARVWIDEVGGQGFICSSPNPQPAGITHYDIQFYYFQPTIAAIGFRTVHPGKWMKIDNVVLTEVFGVGIPPPVMTDRTYPTEYFDTLGRSIPGPLDKGIWLERRGSVTVKKGR